MILVIEDDPDVTRTVQFLLEEDGYRVLTASNGWTGIRCAQETAPALVLLDLGLPDLDGEVVLRHLRAGGLMPVLILSGADDVARKVALLNAGADGYLTKPFHPEELLARVQALLRPVLSSTRMVFGPLVIQLDRRRCFYEGFDVPLTEREFDLLCLLAGQPGRVCSREEITRALTSQDLGHTNLVDVHVANLRSKLRDVGGFGVIRTVRGVGYALKMPTERPTLQST